MLCRVADEPVVVLKSLPEKPGNGVEDKTKMICSRVFAGAVGEAKSAGSC